MSTEKKNSITDIFGEVISSYSRKQAIEDGVLVDITELAKEAGFKYPVCITTGVYELTQDAVNKGGKDYLGVLWDILTMLMCNIKSQKESGARIDFTVRIWSKYTGKDALVKMYSTCGPGDNAEPVLTILLPTED